MDGTLVDSELNTGFAVEKLLESSGIDMGDLDTTQYYGITWAAIAADVLSRFPQLNLPQQDVESLLDRYFHQGPQPEEIKGASVAVRNAHATMKTAIVTSSNHGSAISMMENLNLLQEFDAVLGAENYTHSKPNPDPYVTAAGELGCKVEESLVFEDSIPGIQAARAAGMSVIAITQRTTNLAEVRRLADATIVNYLELPHQFFR